MTAIPSELKYTVTHAWARLEDDGIVTVGITDHAQCASGAVVFLELPELDIDIEADAEAGVIESTTAATDVYSPLSGTIVAVNEKIIGTPEIINQDPYGEGWLFKLQPFDEDDLHELLDADDYAEHLASTKH